MAGLGETLIGHKSLLRCPGGFISQANSEIYVKCIPNPKDNILGQWDTYTSFLCTPLECNPLFLPKFEHSKMTIPPLPVTVYSTGVTITCVENYYLNTSVITNSIEIKCVYSSPSKAVMWDIPNFKCIETKCSLSKSVAIHSNIYGELLSLLSNSNTLVPVGHSFSYYCPRYFYNRDQNKNDVDFQCVRPKDQFVAHPSPDIEEEILSKCERKQCNTADFGTENWYKIDCHMVTILRCTRGKTLNFYGEISQSLSAICNCSSAITAGGSFFHKNKVIQKQKCSDLKCYRRNINEIPNSNYQDLPLETLANQKITVVCKQGFYIKNSEPKQSKKDMTCILKKTYS